MTWSARIVEQDGTLVAELDGVTVDEIRLALNQPRTGSISVPTVVDGLDLLETSDGDTVNELQVYYGDELALWGVPAAINYAPDVTSIDLADPLWLMGLRIIGDLEEENLLLNPSFEEGTYVDSGLDIPNDWVNDSLEDTDVGYSVNAIDGTNIVALITSAGGINRSLVQDVLVGTLTEPTVHIATVYCWVEPLVAFDNTAPDTEANYELGLVARVYDGNDPDTDTIIDEAWYKLNDSVDRFGWTRMSVPVRVPVHTGDYAVRFELHPALESGKVYYDAARLVAVHRLSFLGTDQATIAETLIEHAQDPTLNKADLGILTDCTATGIPRNRIYPWAEPVTVFDALTDLADMDDGIDFDIVCTPTTKTFTTYHPQGNGSTATFTWGGNITGWTLSSGLAQAAGSVAVFGEGTTDSVGLADDRERQWVSDSTAHSGRLLEVAEMGTVRVNTSELLDQAQGILDARRSPRVLTIQVRDPDVDWVARVLTGEFGIGDECEVTIAHGPVQIDETFRVVEIGIDPATGTITPVLELQRVGS